MRIASAAAAPQFQARNDDGPSETLPPASPADAQSAGERARANLATVQGHWRDVLHRDGTDGRGKQPGFVIQSELFNAIADSKSWTIRLGRYGPDKWFADDMTTLNHEYTHLVIFDETNGTSQGLAARWKQAIGRHHKRALQLAGTGKQRLADAERRKADRFHMLTNQYMAIHEGVADVMGAALTHSWVTPSRDARNGTGIISDYRLYANRQSWSDDPKLSNREAHIASGIVSNAASDIEAKLGWDAMEAIFYAVITDDRFTDAALFSDVARLSVEHAGTLYGAAAADVARAAFADNHVPM